MSSEQERRTIRNKEEYFKEFPEHVRAEALKHILDIRKFEIEMYWKRAGYFWVFIGAALGGYIAFLRNSEPSDLHRKGQFILITLGVLFSLCWYFVNRGSKFWQVNWEKHLDIIEDNLIGPLYKTTIHRDYYKKKWYYLNQQYPFSVSKINILLSFFVLILWVGIDINFIYENWSHFFPGIELRHFFRDYLLFRPGWWTLYTGLFLFQFISTVSLFCFAKTGKRRNDKFATHIFFDQRVFTENTQGTSKG